MVKQANLGTEAALGIDGKKDKLSFSEPLGRGGRLFVNALAWRALIG